MRLVPAALIALTLLCFGGCHFDSSGLASPDVGPDLVRLLDLGLVDLTPPDLRPGDAPTGDLSLDASALSCATILDPDTLLLLRFEKVNGASFKDTTGNHVGVASAKPSLVKGPTGCGRALALPAGGGQVVEVPDTAAFQLNEGSIDFWVRFDTPPSWTGFSGIISRDATGYVKPGHLTIYRSCEGFITVRLQDGKSYRQCASGVAPQGSWFHVLVNFGPTSGLQLLINGALQSGAQSVTHGSGANTCTISSVCGASTTAGISGNSNPWIIGASAMNSPEGQGTPSTSPLIGAIDEVRVSKKPR